MAFAAYPPFDGTLQRYYKLSVDSKPAESTLTCSPADLVYALPDSVDLVYGAMMEPLSVAVHSLRTVGGLRTGDTCLIFGAGPVGLLAMGVAKGLGAKKIIAVDINEERLQFAKTYAATHTYIPVSMSKTTLCRFALAHGRSNRRKGRLEPCTRSERQTTCSLRRALRREERDPSTLPWTPREPRPVSRWV